VLRTSEGGFAPLPMPPPRIGCAGKSLLEAIGKSALGIQEGMFRFGSGPQGA